MRGDDKTEIAAREQSLDSRERQLAEAESLRLSEERFRLAARATGDVVYDWDLEQDVLWLSEAVTRNFGHPNRSPKGDWWTALIHPDEAPRIQAALSSAVDSGATFWSNEYRFRRADGSYADVFDRRHISRDASGQPTRMVGSLVDISERARGALSLRKAKESAEAAARAKSQFLANMSHEIRTPLTAVLGFADQLLEPRLSERDRLDYVMTIRRNGEHLLSILNDILDLSKVEAGKLSVEHIPCAPAEVLRDVAALMRVRAIEKGLTFELAHETPIPKLVRTDPTRLRQIVLNLVSNAIKFTEHGSVRVSAGYKLTDGGRPELRIAVSDTGIGIDRAQLGRLFQPFSQADASMTRRYGGSGLGLGISGPLAAALGGGITVESEPGRGSTFVLRIRVDAVAEPVGSEPVDPPRPGEPDLTPPSVGEGRVLLAEDGPDNQLLIGMLLRKQGMEVEVVDNGRTAVERAVEAAQHGRAFDVVLMDMQMPELDGYAASAELRCCGYTRPIVALTAHAMAGERERCLNAGCDNYLTKPIEQSRLITLVRAHVHAQRGEQRVRLPVTNGAGHMRGPRDFAQRGGHERLISLFAHDPDMAEIVAGFVRGLPIQVAALWAAHARADRGLLARLAHQLKGAAGGYGFPTITEAAAQLEELAKSDASVHQALTELVERCERTQRSERPPSLEPEKLGEPARILAIDDSPMIQQLIEIRLRAENVHVFCALSATEGLALAREQPPDLILLDLNLPDASGFDVCRALQSDPATAFVPVLFLTSNADPSTKAAALDLGAVDYVTKPFDATELRARVRSALRTKHYQDLLATRAQVDGLTGLWNRAHFDARLVDELAAAERHARPLALAMLDLDHFKRINDTYGHPFGDQVLQAVAGVLTKTVRSSDLVCRYGGEEFVAILRETGVDAALASAQRLRTAMSRLSLSSGSQSIDVTISLGVVAIEPPYDAQKGELSPSILVGAADAALYQAKRAGRDRVVLSTPPLR